jgi:hypothetical protein
MDHNIFITVIIHSGLDIACCITYEVDVIVNLFAPISELGCLPVLHTEYHI